MWLEVEVGPGLFTPPEDDSFSVDYTMEAANRAYPSCTGVYLGSEGHMLAFYGRKGSTRTGLTQDVAVEACRAVSQLPTWMGFTARWLGVSALPRRMTPWRVARGLRRRIRGESVCIFRGKSPRCSNSPISHPLLFPFSPRWLSHP